MSTIKDVARRTGLSLSTISKYLNGGNVREENRLAIDAAIEELDYSVNVFARSLKANRSMTIGVLLPTISARSSGASWRQWSLCCAAAVTSASSAATILTASRS